MLSQIPVQPGMYLRVTARVKAVSGNLPSVRIAGYAATSGGANVAAVDQIGPTMTLTDLWAGGDGDGDHRIGEPAAAATWSGAPRAAYGAPRA